MKKILMLVLVIAILTTGLFAQDTTWTNPYAHIYLGGTQYPGGSMISDVSNGTIYDGIDVLLTSPAELSNFEGVSLYTAYGNYEDWYEANLSGDVATVNPFSTTAASGFFQLGYLMPIMGMQAGILTGFDTGVNGNLIGYTGNTTYTETTSSVNDASNNNGTADFSNTESASYTDYSANDFFTFGTGIDLGFMGVSVAGTIANNNRTLGGTYDYAYTVGEVVPADGSAMTTSKTVRYGYGEDGAATAKGVKDDNWNISSVGQFPFALGEISMPITASLFVTGENDGGASSYQIPQIISITDAYSIGDGSAPGAVADVSTLTYTQGAANLAAGTTSGEDLGVGAAGNATWADVTAISVAPANYANDADNLVDGDITFGLGVQVDPKIGISDILTARTRVKADLSIEKANDTKAGFITINYSEANSATTNSTYSYNGTAVSTASVFTTELTMELGGILEAASPSDFVTVSSGLFYNPTLSFGSTTSAPKETTRTVSWVDTVNTNEATAATVFADIGPGGLGTEGTVTETTTTTYADKAKTNTFEHRFTIPVSTQLNLVKNKLSLVGGYLLTADVTKTTSETPNSSSDTVTTIATSDGTDVTPAASTSVTSSTTSSTASSWSTTGWAGQMSFMLRWMPTSELTVDFYGESIMDALDMDIFGGGGGFNASDFIDNLGMSVTYHM